MATVTLKIDLNEIGQISHLLDQHMEGSALQKKWDALYLHVNNMPFEVVKVSFPKRESHP